MYLLEDGGGIQLHLHPRGGGVGAGLRALHPFLWPGRVCGGWGINHINLPLSVFVPEVGVGGRAKGCWEPRGRSTLEGDFGEPQPTGEGKGEVSLTLRLQCHYQTTAKEFC